MPELYRESMQKVPFERCNLRRCTSVTLRLGYARWRAVESVAHNRVANRREMYPDLVRSSRLNLHFQQGELAVSALNLLSYLPVRDRRAARPALTRAARSHARATDHIAADGSGNRPFCHFGPAVHQSDI